MTRCILCGYEISGEKPGICPECGGAFDPTDSRSTLSHDNKQLLTNSWVLAGVCWAILTANTLFLAWTGVVSLPAALVLASGIFTGVWGFFATRETASLDTRESFISIACAYFVLMMVCAYVGLAFR